MRNKVGHQGKLKLFKYVCPWPNCGYEFQGYLPEELDNVMIKCDNCGNFIRKRDFK